MRNLVIGFLAGALLTGAVAFADVQSDVARTVQAQLGSMMMTVITLQARLNDAETRAQACQNQLKASKHK